MRNEVIFAGFGGQGVVKAALLLSYAAGLYEDKEVAQTQSYGPEARGGACRSEVVISDMEIDYIKTLHNVDAFVVMSQPAMDKYAGKIDRTGTVVIADSTLVKNIPDEFKHVYRVAATKTAEEELGKALFANIVMLGALSGLTRLVDLSSLEKSLEGNVPPKTTAINKKALALGYAIAESLKQP